MAEIEDYVKSWIDTAERMREQFKRLNPDLIQGFATAQRDMERAIAPLMEANRQFAEIGRRITLPPIDLPKVALPQFDFAVAAPLEQLTAVNQLFKNAFAPAVTQLLESMRELPPRTRDALLALGAQGWYLDFEWTMPQVYALKDAIAEGELAEVEKELVKHFEERLDGIESALVEKFPKRARIFQSAFAAHRRKEYELSIPVILAQTDGICKEITQKYFFIRQDKRPQVAAYVEQTFADEFKAALLSPLCKTLPIAASEKERSSESDLLNRHAVLHGESVSYGTQINSLKAISLINYIAHAF